MRRCSSTGDVRRSSGAQEHRTASNKESPTSPILDSSPVQRAQTVTISSPTRLGGRPTSAQITPRNRSPSTAAGTFADLAQHGTCGRWNHVWCRRLTGTREERFESVERFPGWHQSQHHGQWTYGENGGCTAGCARQTGGRRCWSVLTACCLHVFIANRQ